MADSTPKFINRFAAEVFGTFVLVFGVISAALFATTFTNGDVNNGAGFLGVAFGLGLAVVVAAYAVGGISGGHFNPAVTLGLAVAGKFAWKDVLGYIVAQLVGAVLAASVLALIASGSAKTAGAIGHGFASTGYDAQSPLGFGLGAVAVAEIVATAILVFVIQGATDKLNPAGFAPLAIGFTLVVLNIGVVPISGASFNPARSIATAIFGGPDALGQVWAFIVFPIIGGLLAGLLYKPLFGRKNA
jgi:aquaporin Z